MRLDLQPDGTSELQPFQACCLKALDSYEFANARGSVSEDGSLTWIFKGSVLEVINSAAGLRVASLNVALQMRDEQATVVCVCEFRCQSRMRLLVAINGAAEQGMVVLLDVATSLVVKAIQIPQQMTCLEPVLQYGGSNVPHWALSEQLRQFYGVVAVGTVGGYVYLIDMCLDIPGIMEPLQLVHFSPLQLLDLREKNVATARKDAVASGRHLAMLLGQDEQSHIKDRFHFRRPDLTAVQSFNEDEVQVTSMKYLLQTGCLAIGYSFGGFHLWRLFNPALEYTSTVEPEDLPVATFVYQEPENDPKNFAYIWVARDDRISEQKQESMCSVSLYQLCYTRKTFYVNYGNFYEELNAVVLRMEHNLTCEPYNSHNTTTWSSQLLSAYTITDPSYHPPATLTINDSYEEGYQGPDLSLCAFVWEAQDSQANGSMDVFMAVFDMNRWYHAQMPSRIKCINVMGQECCPYFAVYQLTDVVQQEGCGFLQGVQIKPGSLLRFVNNSPMPPEQHFYPSSLAFDAVCVFSNGICLVSFLGVQRQILANLESVGPTCLLQPSDFYHRCIQTGLLPRAPETPTSVSLEEHQRTLLLTMALEHGRIRFITACIHSWADGEFVHQGCTLQFLLSWAWDRVTTVKQHIDATCRPLYDWSGMPVDQRMLQVLHSCLCGLANLRTVLHMLLTQSTSVTDQGQAELEHRIQVVTLLHCHLMLVLWFVHNGLLPEHDEAGEPSPSRYIYPASELTQMFRDRRAEMKKLHREADTQKMILIDALINSARTAISELWQNEGGSGQYPPPSLHAALSMYLLDSVDMNTKNAVMLYLLFDLAAVAHGQQAEFAEKIPLFAKAFDVPPGLVQQVHGFWLIDHMNFEEGLTQLLRQGSCQDLGPWQHSCVLHALLSQGEITAAARYLMARNPPVLTPEDIKMRLSILVASRLVWQALAYIRCSCGPTQQEDMLKHIFQACQQRKLMELLFELPLTDKEEQCLQTFLSENVDATSAELLVLHLLQRAQYVPAIRLNDRMQHRATMDMSAKARDRVRTRNMIVDGFRQCLPATQQYLINHPPAAAKILFPHRVEAPRPKPLSTVVTKRVECQVSSQSSLVMAVMDKVMEAGRVLAEEEQVEEAMDVQEEEPNIPQKADVLTCETLAVHNPGPFLCTPTLSHVRSRLSMIGSVVYPMVKAVTTPGLAMSHILNSPLSPQHTRRSKVFTADCMSLLQTPKIYHTPARPISPLQCSITPQSILKVSRLPRSSLRSKVTVSRPSPLETRRKHLGFDGPFKVSPPATPTSLSPSSTPSPLSEIPPVLSAFGMSTTRRVSGATYSTTSAASAVTSESASDVATPKLLRFASPEIQEISPPYVSPDNLARPPLRSAPQGLPEKGSPKAGETSVTSDKVTMNFERQQAQSDTQSPSPAKVPETADSDADPASSSSHSGSTQPTPTHHAQKRPPSRTEDTEESIEERIKRMKKRGKGSRPGTPVSPRPSYVGPPMRMLSEVEIGEENEASTSRRASVDIGASVQYLYQTEIVVRSGKHTVDKGVTETTVVVETEDSVPVIEFEDQSENARAVSADALETVEPSVEEELEAVRERTVAPDSAIVDDNPHGVVEIASDDEFPDLEIQPPTPIKRSSRSNTPEREIKRLKTAHLSRKQSATSSQDEETAVTPSKQQKRSLRQESKERTPKLELAEASEFQEELAPGSLRAEMSDDEDKNENRSSMSPPVSPARRSSRRSVERSTPERSTRGGKPSGSKVQEEIIVQTKSSTDDMMPPPAMSPSRRLGRRGTPERAASMKAETSERITRSSDRAGKSSEVIPGESSDSGVKNSMMPDASTDTEMALSKALQHKEEEDVPKFSRRSSGRSETPEATATPAESATPTRQSRRRSKTPDTMQVSPIALSPTRQKSLALKRVEDMSAVITEPEAPASSGRSSRSLKTRRGSTSVDSMGGEIPTSPSRRSSRLSKTLERSDSADVEKPAPASPGRRSTHRSLDKAASADTVESKPAPPSPSRHSARISTERTSVDSEPVPPSPSRRLTRSSTDRTVSSELVDSTSGATPTRRSSRRQSKTPERSPARHSTRLRSKEAEEGADLPEEVMDVSKTTEQVWSNQSRQKAERTEEVIDIATATEQVRRSRQQQKVVSPGSGAKKNLMSVLNARTEDAGSFQFAAPTQLTRLQTEPSLAPAADMATFVFSPPILRPINPEPRRRTRKQSAASSSSEGAPELSAAVELEPPVLEAEMLTSEAAEEEPQEVDQDEEEAETSAAAESRRKKARTAAGHKKKKTGTLPSASPTDSPINLLSQAEAMSSSVSERGASLPKRGSQRKTTTKTTRVLRKRQAKLW